MVLRKLWNIFLCLLTSAIATVNIVDDNDIDIVDAIAGERVIIRRWPLNGSNMSINVKQGTGTLLNAFLDESMDETTTAQYGRLILKYDHTIKEVSLIFDNVSKLDEGLYQLDESFQGTKETPYKIETEAHQRKDGSWSLELHVLDPREAKQGHVGENIIMEYGNTSYQSLLYIYDQFVALLVGSVCSILTDSYLYGRLKCTGDVSGKMYKITIENVTQRDSGLYKVVTGRGESGRFFFNIQGNATRTVPGDNITIGWYYNQQGKIRTLLVIHPNQEVMMMIPPTNIPQIKSNFQHRLLYSGDASKCFMLFTLLNVRQSDAGLYTIETVHGNTIPGRKELIVEASYLNKIKTDEPPTAESACDMESVVWGAACVILLMTMCLICMQRRNSWRREAGQRHSLERCETVSFTIPATVRRPLPMPPLEEVKTDQSVTEYVGVSNAILGLHYAARDVLSSAHTECSSIYSYVHSEYDKITIDNGVNCNKSSDKFKVTASTSCHDEVEEGSLQVESPSVSAFVTTIGSDEYKYNRNDQRQLVQSGLTSYAKVKKSPIVSCRNTGETEEDDGYKLACNPTNQRSTENINVPEDKDAVSTRDKNPTEQNIIPIIDLNV